jgi:hypothetical protein
MLNEGSKLTDLAPIVLRQMAPPDGIADARSIDSGR